jgi:carotenoid cleavage dioxygenase
MSDELPFYLKGNHAPVERELTDTKLEVVGEIPSGLEGRYLRNGPNPRAGEDAGHWFLGHGMIHGVRLSGGRADWYRNRWVQTRELLEDDAERVSEEGEVDFTVAMANTNVLGHAGKILALVESSFPTELTPELETVGITDFGGRLKAAVTAHPKICPKTGEMLAFGYHFAPPFVTYHQFGADGTLLRSEPIDVPGPTMMHDFGITENHVIFMDLPVCFSGEELEASGMPYVWQPEYGARLGVMPRSGGNADVKWMEIDPCYVFHPANAYERNGQIVMEVARYAELWSRSGNEFDPARLTRWTIDVDAGIVKEERLDDQSIEFPRVDPRCEGQPHRYSYAVATDVSNGVSTQHLIKYDTQKGSSEKHDFGPGRSPGEFVFVPASPNAAEDGGFAMGYVYDANRNSSDFVILDGANFRADPLAIVKLPQRVPMGFHGNWIPDRA